MSKRDFLYVLFVSSLAALFNLTLAYSNSGLYIIYFIGGMLFLFFLLCKFSWVYYAILILTINMNEYSRYISQEGFYTFRTVNIFGISFLSIFIVLLIIYKLLFSKNRFKPFAHPFFRWGLFVLSTAFCLGIVYLAFDYTSIKGFKEDLFYFILLFGSFYLAYNFANTEIVEEILLIGILMSPIFILLGWISLPLGSYGGAPISSFDPLYYAIPLIPSFLLFFRKQKQPQNKILFWLVTISSICSIITVILQASGKILIFLPAGIILSWLLLIKKHPIKKYVLIGITIVLIISVSIILIPDIIESYGSILLKVKSYQVSSLFKFTLAMLSNPETVYLMEPSPRLRVLEFMNILKEFQEFPINLLVGKGIGGSFTDKYYYIPLPLFPLGAYSEDQWASREFYRVHETLNFVLLKFGILGIIFLLLLLIWLLRGLYSESSSERCFLYIILIFGVLFMLGYSLKLAIFFGTTIGILANRRTRLPTVGENKQ